MKTFKQYLFLMEADETTLYNQLYKNMEKKDYEWIIRNDITSDIGTKDGKDFVYKVGKYSKWVLDLYRKDPKFKTKYSNQEGLHDIFNAFTLYDKQKNKLAGEFEKYKNISNIKTVDELLAIAHQLNKILSDEKIASRGDINKAEKFKSHMDKRK